MTVKEEVKTLQSERAIQWGNYFEQLLIDYIHQTRVLLTSKAAVARFIGLSAVTVGDWMNKKAFPTRQNCILIANLFSRDYEEVLVAAGYVPTQDDSYNTFDALMVTVQQNQDISVEEKQRILNALAEAITPVFNTDVRASEWCELVRVILNAKFAPLSKAAKIADMIDLWHADLQKVK